MADKLRIRDDVFETLQRSLRSARQDLSQAGEISSTVAEAVGHRGLADELNRFANNWEITRDKLVDSIDALDSQIRGVVETFEKTDRGAADSLTPDNTSGNANGSGSGQGGQSDVRSGRSAAGSRTPQENDASGSPLGAMPPPPAEVISHAAQAPVVHTSSPDLSGPDLAAIDGGGPDPAEVNPTDPALTSPFDVDPQPEAPSAPDDDTSPTDPVLVDPPLDVQDASDAPTEGDANTDADPLGGASDAGAGSGAGLPGAPPPGMPEMPAESSLDGLAQAPGLGGGSTSGDLGSSVGDDAGGLFGAAALPDLPDLPGSAEDAAKAAALSPMVGGAAMGMAAMGANSAATAPAQGPGATAGPAQSRSDEDRAREAREILQKLKDQRKRGDDS